LVLPIFALANAGILLNMNDFMSSLLHPVTQGVIAGLMLGKLLGIAGVSGLVVALGWAKLPEGVSFSQIVGVGLLGGIGFTMSIFIAEIGFVGHDVLINQAKLGILVASVLAGILGYAFLRWQTR